MFGEASELVREVLLEDCEAEIVVSGNSTREARKGGRREGGKGGRTALESLVKGDHLRLADRRVQLEAASEGDDL